MLDSARMSELVRNEMALVALEDALLANHGDLTAACRQLGTTPGQVTRWMRTDTEVHQRINAATAEGQALLEGVIYERAVTGYDEPVYQKGECVGYKRVYSDTLLALMAKARIPGYKADSSPHGGLTVNVAVLPRASSYDEWLEQRETQLQLENPMRLITMQDEVPESTSSVPVGTSREVEGHIATNPTPPEGAGILASGLEPAPSTQSARNDGLFSGSPSGLRDVL